jgi:iron complex outermembrane recepter protein
MLIRSPTDDCRSSFAFLCLFLLSLAPFQTAFAQAEAEQEDVWAGIEEMLVVGSGASALGMLSETGSVTAFSADDLSAYGIENTTDLADFTPNLEIVQNSATTATFFIRGVGLQDFNATAAGAIAIYLDGVPLNAPPLQIAPIFDATSVDVLKGPQGRGNHRNATGGIIAIQSKKPDLDSPSFNASTSQGRFYSVDAIDAYTSEYEAGLSLPIVQDVLAGRFAFRASQSDPFFTNRCALAQDAPGVSVCNEPNSAAGVIPPGLDKEVGDRSVFSLRQSLLFAPETDSDLEFLGTFYWSRRDQGGQFGQATGATGNIAGTGIVALGVPVGGVGGGGLPYQEPDGRAEIQELGGPGDPNALLGFAENFAKTRPLDRHPYTGDYNKNGKQRVEIMGGSLNISADLGFAEMTATSGAARFETKSDADSDNVPVVIFELVTKNRATQLSQDLVLSGELESVALNWEVGGYFLWEDLEFSTGTVLTTSEFTRRITQDTFSYGAFAGLDVDFLDDFTFSAGARLNTEFKQFSIERITPRLAGTPFFIREAGDELTWREPTGTVQLLYRFSESTSAYVKFNHGFKPGHFNSNGTQGRVDPLRIRDPAKPELIDAFEFGLTGAYWDDRVRFSGALFHYDYQDYQVFLFEDVPNGPPSLEVRNANDARVIGAEVDFRIQPLIGFVPEPVEAMEILLRGGWLDSKFLDFQVSSLQQFGANSFETVTDYTGNSLLNSPRFTVSGGIKWAFGLGRFGEIEPRWDFSWTDDQYFDPSEGKGSNRATGAQLPEFTLGQRAYILHNVRLTYRPPERHFELSGWCRNVADERYKTYAFDVSKFRSIVVTNLADPRSCGADVSFTW